MPRRILVLNAVLAIVIVAFAVGIVRTLLVKHPMPPPTAPRAALAPPPSVIAEANDPGPEAYAVIAVQNLFNPARSETAARSQKLDFVDADEADDDELNDILWRAIRKSEPPVPVRSYFSRSKAARSLLR